MQQVQVAGPEARTIKVPLSFLGEGQYNSTMVCDNKENDAAVVIKNSIARRGDTLTIEMAKGGGFVDRFLKQ